MQNAEASRGNTLSFPYTTQRQTSLQAEFEHTVYHDLLILNPAISVTLFMIKVNQGRYVLTG